MKFINFQVILFGVLAVCCNQSNAQEGGYHIEKVYKISTPGSWDYIAISPVADLVYVAHSTHVNILNKNTGDSIAIIPNTLGVHGIAFAPAFNKGFTSNGKTNNLTVFDLQTNEVTGTITTGGNPDAIIYDGFTKRIYVCNGKSNDLSIIDPADNKVEKTIPLGGKPETAVSDGAGRLYINIEDKNEVIVYNTKTSILENHWHTGKGEEPAGLAIDTKAKRLFVGCANKLMVIISIDSGKVTNELPIGEGCDGVAFDPMFHLIFAANGDGTLTAIKEKTQKEYSVIENAKTQKGARTLAIDAKTHKIYLPTADFETLKNKDEHTRPTIKAGTFRVLVVGNSKY